MKTLIAACALLVSASAFAETAEESVRARKLFEEGVALARDKKWSLALEALEASRVLVERPRTVFNIGSVLLRLGRAGEAIAAFEAFLRISPAEDDAGRGAARQLIEEAAKVRAELALEVVPAGAEVFVDGARVEGRRVVIDAGEHRVRVSATGFVGAERAVRVAPGEKSSVAIALEPIAQPLAAVQEEPSQIVASPVAAAEQPPIVEHNLPPGQEDSVSPYVWVAIAGAAVLAAIAIGAVVASGTEEPYRGTLGEVLTGLEDR
jgi:hypothetical protein